MSKADIICRVMKVPSVQFSLGSLFCIPDFRENTSS